MARRYSRIKQARQLEDAYTAYRRYEDTVRPRRVGQGTPRDPSIDVGVIPFGFDIDDGTYILTSGTTRSRDQLNSSINVGGQRAKTPLATGDKRNRIPGFSPARIVYFEGSATGSVATSAITGLQYLKYSGRTYTFPFGRSIATEDEMDAFEAIRAALLGAGGGGSRRVSINPERKRYR